MTELKADRFKQIYDRCAWGAITLVAVYSANMLKELSNTVQLMSTNLAVMTSEVVSLRDKQKDYDVAMEKQNEKIRTLELSSVSRVKRHIQVDPFSE